MEDCILRILRMCSTSNYLLGPSDRPRPSCIGIPLCVMCRQTLQNINHILKNYSTA